MCLCVICVYLFDYFAALFWLLFMLIAYALICLVLWYVAFALFAWFTFVSGDFVCYVAVVVLFWCFSFC